MARFPSLFNMLRDIFLSSSSGAVNAPTPELNLDFSGVTVTQDTIAPSRFFVRGDNFAGYQEFWTNIENFRYAENPDSEIIFVRAKDIEGVYLYENEVFNPNGFWTRNGKEGWTQEAILDKASHLSELRARVESGSTLDELLDDPELGPTAGSYMGKPISVVKYGDSYIFDGDGRHRTIAAQLQDEYIPVQVKGEYIAIEEEEDETVEVTETEVTEETVAITNQETTEIEESVPNQGLPAGSEETVTSDMVNTNVEVQTSATEVTNTTTETNTITNDEGMDL